MAYSYRPNVKLKGPVYRFRVITTHFWAYKTEVVSTSIATSDTPSFGIPLNRNTPKK